jgi:trimeric autotransporter adhesin
MKMIFTLVLGLMMVGECCLAQNVGIGTTSPDPSAQLDINSGARGILIPRMTTVAVSGIANPAKGLMIYDSTRNQLLVNMGTPAAPDWENIVANSGWGLNGNKGINSVTQFIGTTDTAALRFGIGGSTVGYVAGRNYNTSLGYQSLPDFAISFGNTAIGAWALQHNAGSVSNTAIGVFALATNTSGAQNCALGASALVNNTYGDDNCGFGYYAGASNVTGYDNVAIGANSMYFNSGGAENTIVGTNALYKTTNSWYNTVVGSNSGVNFDNGYNNVFLGANNDVNGPDYFNVIAIGQGVTCTASSQARIGNSATNSIGGYANWTNFSDGRYKKNMRENVKGIDFIMRLRPLTYNLDVTGIQNKLGTKRPTDAGSQRAIAEKENMVFSGFAAQEVEQAAKDAGYEFSGVDKPKNANDFYGLRYGDFVVPLVKAVQEQQQMIKDLQQQVAELKKQQQH